jgi:acyl-CoA synthetase (AMP-forming)/AMP-acid ligase II
MEPALAKASREAARAYGDIVFSTWGDGHTITFSELDRLSDEVAAWMCLRRIGPGDVVLLAMPSVPEYMVAYVASQKVGALAAGINARLSPPERAALCELVEPRLVMATADLLPPELPESTLIVEVTPVGNPGSMLLLARRKGEAPPQVEVAPDSPAAIVFTSGTTGLPKAAVFGQRQLMAIASADAGGHHLHASTLVGTSLALLGFMTKLESYLEQGCSLLLMQEWHARDALRLVAEHHLSTIGGIPTQIALMLRLPEFDDYDLSAVKRIVLGGAPAPAALIRDARRRVGVPVLVRYSCTEAGIGLGTSEGDPPEDAEISVGRPRKGVELTIRDEEQRPRATGEIGEVCLKSDASMLCYYRNPQATADVFTADRAVRTGDMGFVDDQGRLRLSGRSKDMYIRGGYNVFPNEVERVLVDHPSVAEVAVVPRPDDVMGEIGVAVVVVRSSDQPPTLEDLRSFAQDRLARHKLPEGLLVIEEIPRSVGEKVDRAQLRRMVEEPQPARHGADTEPGADKEQRRA